MAKFRDIVSAPVKGPRQQKPQSKIEVLARSEVARHFPGWYLQTCRLLLLSFKKYVNEAALRLFQSTIPSMIKRYLYNNACPIRALTLGKDFSSWYPRITVKGVYKFEDTTREEFVKFVASDFTSRMPLISELIQSVKNINFSTLPNGWFNSLDKGQLSKNINEWARYNTVFKSRAFDIFKKKRLASGNRKSEARKLIHAKFEVVSSSVPTIHGHILTQYGVIFRGACYDSHRCFLVVDDTIDLSNPDAWSLYILSHSEAKFAASDFGVKAYAEKVGDQKFLAIMTAAELARKGEQP